jgi:hypothetical protein
MSCPCTLTTPCHPDCSCGNPVASGGCWRCCTYGSREQRKAMAEDILRREVKAREVEQDLRDAVIFLRRMLRYDGCTPQTFDSQVADWLRRKFPANVLR